MCVAAAVVGATVVGSVLSSNAQSDAANSAAGAQRDASTMSTAEQRRQFDALQALMRPYADVGVPALTAQQNLIGLNGNGAQQTAIDSIANGAQFKTLAAQGEDAILQNASATGGLRGGNVQGALATFRPAMLQQLIDSQYQKLGGLTSLGENAAAGVGNAGMALGASIGSNIQQAGAATAGAYLADGRAQAQLYNSIPQAFGMYAGMKGF